MGGSPEHIPRGPWDGRGLRGFPGSCPGGLPPPPPPPPSSYSVHRGAVGTWPSRLRTETTSAMQRFRLPLSSLMVMGRSSLILSMASGQSS